MDSKTLNSATEIADDQIKEIMNYHSWSEEKIQKGSAVREALGQALKVIIENVPPSPDRTTAIRKIREARMDCNSAITFDGAM